MHRKKYVVLLAILVLFIFTPFYALRTDYIEHRLADFLADNISHKLGVKLDVDSIHLESLQKLVAHDIQLYDKENKEILKVRDVDILLSPSAIFSDDKINIIADITLKNSELFLRQKANDTWNYQDLITQDEEETDFFGKVHLENLTLYLSYLEKENDYAQNPSEKTLRVETISGEVDFSDKKSIALALQGDIEHSPLKIAGILGKKEKTTSLDVTGENLKLGDCFAYLPLQNLSDKVELLGGRVETLALHIDGKGSDFSYSGKAHVQDASLLFDEKKFTSITGDLRYEAEKIDVSLTAKLKEEPLSLKGKVFLKNEKNVSELDLMLEAKEFTPKNFFEDLLFSGKTSMQVKFTQETAHPKIDAMLDAKEGEILSHFVQNAHLHLIYQDEVFHIEDFSGDLSGGSIKGSGTYAYGTIKGKADFHSLSLEEFKKYLPFVEEDTSATISGNIDFQQEAKDLEISGTLDARDISCAGEFLPHVAIDFQKQGENIKLQHTRLDFSSEGYLELAGLLQNKRIDLTYKGENIPLRLLQKIDPRLNLRGSASVDGEIKGDLSRPTVKVRISAKEGKILEQPYDYLEGAFSGNLDAVKVDKFFMEKDGKKTWLLQGSIGFTGEKKVALQIDTIGARMEDIARFAFPEQNITGNVDNIITISGTLDNPKAIGYIHFYIGSYEGALISGMDGDYDLADGVMTLHDFHIYAPLIDMDLNGIVRRDWSLDLKVEAHDVDFNRFNRLLPYPVSGHGKFTGKIGGFLHAPTFEGKVTSEELLFNEELIKNAHGNLNYIDNSLTLYDFGFADKEGTYRMDANVNLAKNTVRGMLEIENGELNTLFSFLNFKNDDIAGKIKGKLLLRGTVDNPHADLNLTLKEGNIFTYPLNDVKLLAAFNDKRLILKEFQGKQGEGTFHVAGNFDLTGDLRGEANLEGIEAGIFAKLANIKEEVHGTLDINAKIRGNHQNPELTLKLIAQNLGVNASPFDDVHALAHYKYNILSLDEIVIAKNLAKKVAQIKGKGYIPFNIFKKDTANGEDMYVKFDFDEADLELFGAMVPFVEKAQGEIKGFINLMGSTKAPRITGSLSLFAGDMRLKYLKNPLTSMQAEIKLLGDKMDILHFTGKMGKGSYSVKGKSSFSGFTPHDYDIDIALQDLEVDSKYYEGALNASLKITEEERFLQKMPLVTGYIPFAHATFLLPSLPEEESTLPEIAFDLDLSLKDKVRFYNPLLYDLKLIGDVYLGGTTVHPRTSGTIFTPRGSIRYLKNRFKVLEGEAYFNQFDSFLPTINLKTETNVGRIRVNMNISGPAQGLNIHLTSTPSLSNEEILRLLTFRHNYEESRGDFNEEVSSMLKAGLKMGILGEVEGAVQDFLNLDEFTISEDFATKTGRATSSYEVYSIGIGKYVSDKVMLNYKKTFGTHEYKYGMRYDFDRKLSMVLSRNQDRAYSIGLEARFRF